MLPPERRRAMLGAPPPRRGARAIRRTTSAGAGDAGEATVGRAGIRRRVGPQAREPRLHARQAVDRRVAATSKEANLLNTEKLCEGDGMRLGIPRRLCQLPARRKVCPGGALRGFALLSVLRVHSFAGARVSLAFVTA